MTLKTKKSSGPRAAKPVRSDKPETTDAYLAALTTEQRGALEALRRAIKAAAPEAEECISYNVPGFRLNGKLLVSYGAAARHCAFYPGSVVQMLKAELKNYDTDKGTVRFSPDKPLPRALVRKLVKLRMAQRR